MFHNFSMILKVENKHELLALIFKNFVEILVYIVKRANKSLKYCKNKIK